MHQTREAVNETRKAVPAAERAMQMTAFTRLEIAEVIRLVSPAMRAVNLRLPLVAKVPLAPTMLRGELAEPGFQASDTRILLAHETIQPALCAFRPVSPVG